MFEDKHDPKRKQTRKTLLAEEDKRSARRRRHLEPGEVPGPDVRDWQLRDKGWQHRVVDRFLAWFFDRTPDTLIRQFVRAIRKMDYHQTNEIMEEISDVVGDIQAQREEEAERVMREAARRHKKE